MRILFYVFYNGVKPYALNYIQSIIQYIPRLTFQGDPIAVKTFSKPSFAFHCMVHTQSFRHDDVSFLFTQPPFLQLHALP